MKVNLSKYFYNHPYIGTIIICLATSILVLWSGYFDCKQLFYGDTDSYTRALRVVDWLSENFQWSEKIFPWSNPPHGFNLHFTRCIDIIWLIFALPFIPFMALKEAVFYAGFFISPLFLILTMLILVKYYREILPPMHNQKTCFLLSVLCTLFLLIKLDDIFYAYRPDHHALMSFIFTANIVALLQGYRAHKIWHFAIIGVLTGVGIWASSAIEGFIIAGSSIAVLCLDWLLRKRDFSDVVFYSLGLFIATTFCYLIDPPLGGYAITDINRLSVIHAVLTAFIFLAFTTLSRLKLQNFFARFSSLLIAAITTLIFMFILFGTKRLLAPIYDEKVLQYFVPLIDEMKPAWKFSYLIPSYIICIIEIIALLKFSKLKLHYMIDLAIIISIFGTLSLFIVRFYLYFLVLFALTTTMLFFVLMHFDYVSEQKNKTYKTLAFILLSGIIFYMFTFRNNYLRYCQKPIKLPTKSICLTDIFAVPRLIFEQNIDTIGSPYHSNIEGIINYHHIWNTQDGQELKYMLKKYNITCIVPPMSFYNDKEGILVKQIKEGTIYPWLKSQDGYFKVDFTEF